MSSLNTKPHYEKGRGKRMFYKAVEKTVEFFENVTYLFGKHLLLSDATAYCQLDATVSLGLQTLGGRDVQDTLITKDGSAVSVFSIAGTSSILPRFIDDPELQFFNTNLARTLAPLLKKPGHHIEVVIESNPDLVESELNDLIASSRRSLNQNGLSIDTLLNSKINKLSSICVSEKVWLVVYTHLSALPSDVIKEEQEDRNKRAEAAGYTAGELGSVNYYNIAKALLSMHKATIENLSKTLQTNCKILLNSLDAHQALKDIKRSIDFKGTSPQWQPQLLGDVITPVRTRDNQVVVHPQSVSYQVAPESISTVGNLVKISGMYYASGHITRGPSSLEGFERLFDRIRGMPWRLSFSLSPNGMDYHKTSRSVVGLLAFVNDYCKDIHRSFKLLEDLRSRENVDVGMQIVFQTWGNTKEEATSNYTKISQQVQAWGSCNVSSTFGDPLLGFFSASPGYSNRNGAHVLVPPVSEAAKLLPMTRPASPWHRGTVIFRTPDGKLFPMSPSSSIQTTWVDVILSPPGSGKSVQLSTLNLGCLMSPGLRRLPFCFIIDIGESSRGLIEMMQSVLPPGRKHEALFKRLQNTTADGVNPFDTQPGCRFPNDVEKTYQQALLMNFATPTGESKPYDGVESLIFDVLRMAYVEYSDGKNPKLYEPTVDPIVDATLQKLNIELPPNPTWWEVTDILWAKGKRHESILAQRYAVPTLSDIASICNTPEIKDSYNKESNHIVVSSTQESLVNAFTRVITSAINQYPALSTVTKLDLGEARLVCLDLQDVAPQGDLAEKKQSATFYLFARFLFVRQTYITNDTLKTWINNCPPMYHDYHREKANQMERELKVLSFDELHRCSSIPSVNAILERDARESRKWFARLAYSSQFLHDFSEGLMEAATNIYAMRYVDPESSSQIQARVGFSDTAMERFSEICRGPVPAGAPFLAQFRTKKGIIEQVLYNTLSAEEMWAFSSTAEDRWLRKNIFARIGAEEGLSVLADLYPIGTCAEEVQNKVAKLAKENERGATRPKNEEVDVDMLQQMADEAYQYYLQKRKSQRVKQVAA